MWAQALTLARWRGWLHLNGLRRAWRHTGAAASAGFQRRAWLGYTTQFGPKTNGAVWADLATHAALHALACQAGIADGNAPGPGCLAFMAHQRIRATGARAGATFGTAAQLEAHLGVTTIAALQYVLRAGGDTRITTGAARCETRLVSDHPGRAGRRCWRRAGSSQSAPQQQPARGVNHAGATLRPQPRRRQAGA